MKPNCSHIFTQFCFVFALLVGWPTAVVHANESAGKLAAGSQLDQLMVGTTAYTHVTIRSISPRSIMITHDGGMKSLLLRDLSPELQQRLGYNPEADRAQEATAKAGQAAAEQQQKAHIEAAKKNRQTSRTQSNSKIDQLMSSFGQAPEIRTEVDLRPKFSELGLWVKSQGYRPSCAVFAIVSALEFQSAESNGTATRFSEEYLVWATRKSLHRAPLQQALVDNSSDDLRGGDAGFALEEVATALRTYGIPPLDVVPNRFSGAVNEPTPEIIEQARNARHVVVNNIPGREGATLVANVIHTLNAGIPVPVGMRWAMGGQNWWRSGYLNEQPAFEDKGHAVTIVGYKSPTGRIEDTVFTFKNSWGLEWGKNGYGFATYKYLSRNLHTAVLLEVSTN